MNLTTFKTSAVRFTDFDSRPFLIPPINRWAIFNRRLRRLLSAKPLTRSPMLKLEGQRLSLAQIAAVAAAKETVALSDSARQRVEKSRRVVEAIVAEGR